MIDTKKIKEIVKEIIEEEIKKERGLIREHIQLELHMLTEGDWFNEYVTKIVEGDLADIWHRSKDKEQGEE
tara:strand:- start:242 stop:454 length:213 start_codon:yes stop_codon:yes gene_type:complete